jgi:hypothetical protein
MNNKQAASDSAGVDASYSSHAITIGPMMDATMWYQHSVA